MHQLLPHSSLWQNVKLTETAYICVQNKVFIGDCSFRITRKLLDKEIPLEEFQKLVSDKNWTYQGFVSRRKDLLTQTLYLKTMVDGFEFPRKKKSARNFKSVNIQIQNNQR